MSINTNNLNGYEFESWQYKAVFIFLQQWLEKILTYLLKSKNQDNIVSTPFFEIKKIGRTKYANYRHVRSTNGLLGILSFNARYLLATPSPAHYAGYVITLAHNLARCLAMRKKTPNNKGKILVSKKEVDAELLEIGLKHSTKDGYQFCLNSWLRNELEKDYGKDFPIQFVEFEEKPVKQNLGEQVTIENAALNEQTQGLVATESIVLSSEQTSEQLSILRQTVADLEQDQKDKADEVEMYKRLANERYSTMIKMQEAFEQEKARIRAEIASLKTTKFEPAPAPAPESKEAPAPAAESKEAPAPAAESKEAPAPAEKAGFFARIFSSLSREDTKAKRGYISATASRLAIQWLKDNEDFIRKTETSFNTTARYLSRATGVTLGRLVEIANGTSKNICLENHTKIMEYAKKRGYVEPKEQSTDNVQAAPASVADEKATTIIEPTLDTQDNNDEKEPTEQERETLALNEVYDTIQSMVATGPKDRYELSKQVKQQSFVFFKESKYSLDTMITRLVDSRQLQCVGGKICAMSYQV